MSDFNDQKDSRFYFDDMEEPSWAGEPPTGPSPRYQILVVWNSGEAEYLKEGATPDGQPAIFRSRRNAQEMRDFLLEGMAEEVQSINVVSAAGPKP